MEEPSETKENDQAQAENGVENPDDTLNLEGEEKDVFSGLSDQEEDNTEGRISREQRSFARYESPRDAVIEESERERGGDGSEVTIKKPSMETFESASSPSTTKVSPETTPAIS